MFAQKSTGRTSEFETPPASKSTSARGIGMADELTPSVISKGLVFVGNAFSNGQIEVSGVYKGDIKCKSLIVGNRADIEGNVTADEILVGGQVKGIIRGQSVTLQEGADIQGDIYHRSLSISEGARFAGRSFQEDNRPASALNGGARKSAGAHAGSKSADAADTKLPAAAE